MLAAEGVPRQLTALKRQHAEHLLEVVRFAEKQEAERQKRLRHATSKFTLAYLQKRFDTERRQNQTQISRLIQDAHAVEAALNKARGNPPEEGHGQKGPGNRDRNKPSNNAEDRENGLGVNRVAAVSGKGGGSGGGGIAGGGGLSGGGEVGGWGAGSECNAFIELPETGAGGDSRFMSAKQMRFMEQVHKREDSQRIPRAATKPNDADATAKRRMRQRIRKREGGGGGGDNHRDGGPAGLRITAAASGVSADKPFPFPRRGQGGGAAGIDKQERDRGASTFSHGTGRQRLLAEKRGILLELKGVVSRQAEALDRLVDSCGDNTLGGAKLTSGVGSGSGSGSSRSGGSGGSKFSGWDSSNSSRSSAAGIRGRYQKNRGNNVIKADRVAGQGGASCYDNGRAKHTSAVSPAATREKGKVFLPPRPPENDTSAFLARGGRWGGEGGPRVSGRNSVASTASYATYANKGRGKREYTFGVCTRRPEVPTLPL